MSPSGVELATFAVSQPTAPLRTLVKGHD